MSLLSWDLVCSPWPCGALLVLEVFPAGQCYCHVAFSLFELFMQNMLSRLAYFIVWFLSPEYQSKPFF